MIEANSKGRGGARKGAGRKRNQPENHGAPRKAEAREIIDSLGKSSGHPDECKCWKCLWKRDGEREDSVGHAARKYLWDRDGGRPVDTVNHLHDKPIDLNVNLSMAELVRGVRERKQAYERSRK